VPSPEIQRAIPESPEKPSRKYSIELRRSSSPRLSTGPPSSSSSPKEEDPYPKRRFLSWWRRTGDSKRPRLLERGLRRKQRGGGTKG
jgi:hypothetical protein